MSLPDWLYVPAKNAFDLIRGKKQQLDIPICTADSIPDDEKGRTEMHRLFLREHRPDCS